MPNHCCWLLLTLLAPVAAPCWAVPTRTDLRLVAAAGAAVGGAAAPGGEESVAVELRTVPFYAVDAEGKPVFDLRNDEVELRVDGKPMPIDTFDRHRLDGNASRADGSAPPRTRDVYLVIDQTFLTMAGLRDAQRMSRVAIGNFLASDRLYLIVNDAKGGFQVVAGPVPGNSAGKERIRERIAALRPQVHAIGIDTELPPIELGGSRMGKPSEQVHNMYEAAGSLMRAEYRDAGEALAQSLRLFALQLGRTGTPKAVVLFTPGLDRKLYFEGENMLLASAADLARHAAPMVEKFRPAFDALAASGANLFLVNPDANRQNGHDYLEQMRAEVGGVLLDQASPQRLARELQASSAALYVAGFYLHPETPVSAGANVEVVARRLGVRVLAPHGFRTPRPWSALDSSERRLAVLDLVQRGVHASAGGPQPEVAALPLAAQVVSASSEKGKGLEMIGEWPAELAGHRVEVYEVLVRTPSGEEQSELVSFRESSLSVPGDPLDVKMSLVPGKLVWALVLVEPTSGATYLRRLSLTLAKTASR